MPRPLESELWGCPGFAVSCPRLWSRLAPTGDARVRFCASCEQHVHLCESPDEFVARGNQGQCVAVRPERVPGRLGFTQVGRADVGFLAHDDGKKKLRDWWNAALDRDPTFLPPVFAQLHGELGRARPTPPPPPSRRPSLQESFERALPQSSPRPGLQETMRLFPGARKPGLQDSFPGAAPAD